jgi:hypothetical protein
LPFLDVTMLKYFSPLHRSPPELLMAGLILILALSYGTFAAWALHSARNGGADLYVSSANPWETVSQGQPSPDHRLAFRTGTGTTP